MSVLDKRLGPKRLVFTAATGRCGTGYLARMLNVLPGVSAFHEPAPDFSEVMRAVQREADVARRFLIERKLPAIARQPASVYVETSHLACKGFWEPLQQLGLCVDLLVLGRPAREVACSLYRLNTIPGRTQQGLQYYLSPADPVFISVPGWRRLHDYQLCFWYCLEIERRQAAYARAHLARGGRVVGTSLAEITSVEGLEKLAGQLQLTVSRWARLWWAYHAGRVVNKKRRGKRTPPSEAELEILEADLLSHIESLRLVA